MELSRCVTEREGHFIAISLLRQPAFKHCSKYPPEHVSGHKHLTKWPIIDTAES